MVTGAGAGPLYDRAMARSVLLLLVVMVWGSALVGCASRPEPVVSSASAYLFNAADYTRVFQAAKDVLREYQFELDRVDARSGIITTEPKPSAGLATPWIPHSGNVTGSIKGLLQHEQRRARVLFTTVDPDESRLPEEIDLRRDEGQLLARIEVTIDRIHRPHRRVSPASIKLGTFAQDTGSPPRGGVRRDYLIQAMPDEALGRRMLRALERKMSDSSATDAQ